MSNEASEEVIVKNEPIFDSQSISEATLRSNQPNKRTNNKQSIKQETQTIEISDSKRTREDIQIDYQSMKVKDEPIDKVEVKAKEKFSATGEFPTTSIAFLNEEAKTSDEETSDDNPISQPKSK